MLAVLGELPGHDAGWGYEFKWDGVRIIAYVHSGQVRLMSRTDRDVTGSYPDLDGPHVRTPPWFAGGGADVLAASAEQGLEGVVAKRLESPYLPGRRSPAWRKVKPVRTQEVVIGGWKPGEGRRAGMIGSLLLGIPGPEGLRYVGHVGTGFTQAMLRDLTDRLAPLARATSPFSGPLPRDHARGARWVEPRLVGEVSYGQWTDDGILR